MKIKITRGPIERRGMRVAEGSIIETDIAEGEWLISKGRAIRAAETAQTTKPVQSVSPVRVARGGCAGCGWK